MAAKRNALGKGLSALLENATTDITSSDLVNEKKIVGGISAIKIDSVETNPFQPRTEFEEQTLKELSESIAEHGIIQPIAVRKLGYDKFQLISGERRLRASQLAGLKEIPAYIRIANDQSMLEMALVENIQRENLNAIEVAISYKRLLDECSLTQEQLAEKVSKKRSTIANYLRLLKLPAEIQVSLRNGDISMGHARALVNIDDPAIQEEVYLKILSDKLSVRDVEDVVRGKKQAEDFRKKTSGSKISKADLSFDDMKTMDDLRSAFNAKVNISKAANGKGKITIPFKSDEDLQRLLTLFDI